MHHLGTGTAWSAWSRSRPGFWQLRVSEREERDIAGLGAADTMNQVTWEQNTIVLQTAANEPRFYVAPEYISGTHIEQLKAWIRCAVLSLTFMAITLTYGLP